MEAKKLFSIHFTEAERATLESERARLGLRSMAEVIRHWIVKAEMDASEKTLGVMEFYAEAPILTNAKGEPRELPKPRQAFKSRLKGVWKAP